MAYNWSSDLETGNKLIDSQHKELIDAVNNLIDACFKLNGLNQLTKTADFLQNYVTMHFNEEEKLQFNTKYPQYQSHKQLHTNFKAVVKNLVNELRVNGPSPKLLNDITTLIGDWIIKHIKNEDTKVAEHIRKFNATA